MSRFAMAIDLRRCAGCGACVVACQLENNQKPGVSWNELDCCEWGDEPGQSGRCYLPHACMHCENAPCVEICPTGATYTREDGIVAVDYEKCISCQACVSACPYGAPVINEETSTSTKCTFCKDRSSKGQEPFCVAACPANARVFGDLNDPDSEVAKLVAAGAEPWQPEAGTEPCVFYIA